MISLDKYKSHKNVSWISYNVNKERKIEIKKSKRIYITDSTDNGISEYSNPINNNGCKCNHPKIERQVNTPDDGTTQSETSLAYFKNFILYGFNDLSGENGNVSGYAFSNDLGNTWSRSRILPNNPGGTNGGDPVIAVDKNGIFYYGQVGVETINGNAEGVISVSTGTVNRKGRISMNPPQIVGRGKNPKADAGSQDKEWIAVGPDRNNRGNEALYIAWTDFTPGRDTTNIRFSKFTTGRHITPIIENKDIVVGNGKFVSGSFVVVDKRGTIYVFYEEIAKNGFGVLGQPNRTIRMTKSTDGGNTFPIDVAVSTPFAAAATTTRPCNQPSIGVNSSRQIRMNEFPHAAIGPDGTLYAVWNAGRVIGSRTFINVFLAYSKDKGASWNQVNVSQSIAYSFFPSVTANCAGAHIQYNRFNDPNLVGGTGNGTFGIFMKTFSLQTGVSNEKVISNPYSRVPVTIDAECYMGDYNQIISGPGSCLLHSWGDNRNVVNGQLNPDVFFALTSLNKNPQ